MKKFSVLIFIIILLVFSFLLFYNNNYENIALWLFPNDENKNGELLKLVLSIYGGLSIIFGLYVSLRRAKAIEDGVKIQNDQIKLSRKSQTDERFKNAVEHLGSDKTPVIIGGVVELHQISKDNIEEYSEIVFDILTSYIRTNSSNHEKKEIIQIIFNYLFKDYSTNPYLRYKADLQKTKLSGIDLSNMNLTEANLSGSELSKIINSNLSNSDLSNCLFFCANLKNTILEKAKLRKTTFYLGEVENCNITPNPDIPELYFINTTLRKVDFINCGVQQWTFINSYLRDCKFYNTDIISSDFAFSNFNNVSFEKINLFSDNDFRGCYFKSSTYSGCTPMKSNFIGARSEKPFNIVLKDEINDLIFYNTDLTGLNNLSKDDLFRCQTGYLDKEDISELLSKYQQFEEKVFGKKKS